MRNVFELGRSVVFPWHCDHFGHMNVRWYAHHFDDAGFHLWTVAGVGQKALRESGRALVVAQIRIDYVREMKAGDLLAIRGGFTRVGNRSVRHHLRMCDADTGGLRATQDTVEVFFDPETRKSAPMPDSCRGRLASMIADFGDPDADPAMTEGPERGDPRQPADPGPGGKHARS